MRHISEFTVFSRIVILLALMLSACNSESDQAVEIAPTLDGTDTVPIQRMGVVYLQSKSDASKATSISAEFLHFETALTADRSVESVVPQLDFCSAGAISSYGLGSAFIFRKDESIDAEDISAGEALVFSSPMGTWYTLFKDPELDDFGYSGRAQLRPKDLTLDIPGDSFPAFSGMPVPNISSLQTITPEDFSALPADKVFRWAPSPDDPDAFVVIEIQGPTGVGDDSMDRTGQVYHCVARDDGELSWREAADEELRSLIDAGTLFRQAAAGRIGITARQSGDALLVIVHWLQENEF